MTTAELSRVMAGLPPPSCCGSIKYPIIEVKGLSDAKRRALALADNKLALNANWDEVILAEELAFSPG